MGCKHVHRIHVAQNKSPEFGGFDFSSLLKFTTTHQAIMCF